ncbi:MAG: hypothetical protein QME64_08375 [bacterium]|nr:hypothetical protein [bacterium]
MSLISELNYQELLARLNRTNEIIDPLKRKLWVLAVISKALSYYDIRPILIGGCAVEYYTFGGYSTYDVDIAVADHDRLTEIMAKLGFEKEGRFWLRKDLDVVVESPAGILVKETAPLTEVQLEDMVCYIIGIEDLIIDRLNGFVHWKWEDDKRWVKQLLDLYQRKLDWNYLNQRAKQEKTDSALDEIKKEISND